jgi:FkbM family methyltransferase
MNGATIKVDEVAIVREALFESGLLADATTMVDVGAHKGTSFAPFVRSGWDVWAFEPSTVMYDALIERFGQWRNLQIFPVAVSDLVADEVSFYVSDQSTGISSLLDFHPSHELSETVATRRLDALPLDDLDFLKIDTEGYDRNVFRSRGPIVPKVIVTEFEDSKTLALGYSAGDYAEELVEAGYRVWVSEWDPIVRYGGDHSWRRLFRYSGTAPDSTAWGNYIAVHESVETDIDTIDAQLFSAVPRT